MNKKIFLTLSLLLLLTLVVNGQEDVEEKSVQDYTPSVLMDKGQTEFKLYNSLFTQIEFFDTLGVRTNDVKRSSILTSIVEYNHGVSNRVTLGGEMWFKSTYIGSETSSAMNVLRFTNSSDSRTGIALIGMKVRYYPVKKWERFSIQTSILLSVISDPQSEKLDRPFIDNNRHLWRTKFLYDKKISNKFQAFTQLSAWVSIDKNLEDENTGIATPFDLFISYFPTKKITIYLHNQFFLSIGTNGISSYFLQEGLGIKYQLFRGVELETSYTSIIVGENIGAGQTFNLALRIIH